MNVERNWVTGLLALLALVLALGLSIGSTLAGDGTSEGSLRQAQVQPSAGANVDSEGNPLHTAAAPGTTEMVEETVIPDGETAVSDITYFKRYAGVDFQPRSSSTSYGYRGVGCIYAGPGENFSLSVQVPSGAEIDFVRFYFFDESAVDGSST